jgi:curved DNA-binding protein CbpA
MAYEFYDVLELSPSSTPEEIKRSYFRLIRKYPPQKEPEKSQSIHEAYETLRDPKARANYDSLQQYGEHISKLVAEASEKMSEGKWKSAIPRLMEVVVLFPGANAALNQLGICFTNTEDWENAFRVYRRLTQNNSDVPLYWSNYGHAFKQYADSLDPNNPEEKKMYEQSRTQFKQAIDLEPYNSEPYLEIARTYTSEKDYTRALSWTERAIGADGKTDFQDFEALFYICSIHLFSGEFDKIQAVADRIISLLPDNNRDLHEYVAARFYNSGLEIAQMGYKNSNVGLLRAASFFFSSAKKFDPNDDDINRLKNQVDSLIKAYDIFDSFTEDKQLSAGFSSLGAFYLTLALNQEIENQDTVLSNIIDTIFNASHNNIISSVRRIKSYYYPVYELNKSLFDKLEGTAQTAMQEASKKSSSQPSFLESLRKLFG